MDEAVNAQIESLVKSNKVFLFMKGNPDFPQCGFSAHAIELLKLHGAEFKTFNVLEDEAVRQGIKVFSDWPTIPQLYVKGEFIGGCDIMNELNESGELADVLKS